MYKTHDKKISLEKIEVIKTQLYTILMSLILWTPFNSCFVFETHFHWIIFFIYYWLVK
jgi:hypothetical protein